MHGSEAIHDKIMYTTPLLLACHADSGLSNSTVGKVDGVENATCAKVIAKNPCEEINTLATIESGSPHIPNAKHVEELPPSNTETKDPTYDGSEANCFNNVSDTHSKESGSELLKSAHSTLKLAYKNNKRYTKYTGSKVPGT